MGQVNVGRVFLAEALAAPDVNLPGESGLRQGVCELPVEGVASAVRLFVDVELQVLQAHGLVILEHGGPGDADGGDAQVPEGLGVALSLNEDGVSGFPDSRQFPLPVEAYLPLAAPHPAKLLFRVPFPNGSFFAVLEVIGHPQGFGAVPVSPRVHPAGVSEEVCREALVEAVPLQGVGAEAAGVGLLGLPLMLRGDAVPGQDFLVGLFRVDALVLRPEGDEVPALILCKAVPLPGLQVNAEAVVPVLVEWAESDQVVPCDLVFLNDGGVFRSVVHDLVEVYTVQRCH